ncbi:hypothetical protein BLOT_015429 [Blomia tropicalis]|nr:hypothetical protein BLOT_015429 [Blomia tropicalis]
MSIHSSVRPLKHRNHSRNQVRQTSISVSSPNGASSGLGVTGIIDDDALTNQSTNILNDEKLLRQCTSTQSKEKSHIQFIFNYFLSSNEKKRKRIKRHIVEFEGYDSIQYDSLDMRPINRIRHIGTVPFQIMGKWSDWFPNDSLYSGCVRILNCFVLFCFFVWLNELQIFAGQYQWME